MTTESTSATEAARHDGSRTSSEELGGVVPKRAAGYVPTEDDVLALQDAVRLLRMIAAGEAYSKDVDLGDSNRKATIRDASSYAQAMLKKIEPLYHRVLDGFVDAPEAT
jgi:hypothetical protein